MKYLFLLCCSLLLSAPQINAQDLLKERIWKLSDRKKSIFFDKGVFYSPSNSRMQKLDAVRNSYVPARGFERIVLDFSDSKIPRVYGHISKSEKKVYLDLFNTSIDQQIPNLKNTKYLKDIEIFNIEKDQVSIELSFKSTVSFDVFYLENPGRLVLDVKK